MKALLEWYVAMVTSLEQPGPAALPLGGGGGDGCGADNGQEEDADQAAGEEAAETGVAYNNEVIHEAAGSARPSTSPQPKKGKEGKQGRRGEPI